MMIIGCDLHTRYQQIAMLDTDTGELVERRLEHENGEARSFFAGLAGEVRVGIEATGRTLDLYVFWDFGSRLTSVLPTRQNAKGWGTRLKE
jgi:hypothetical protein